ncbi:MAG: adenosylcobinamide-GDP ribazoletransferase [Candidatus Nanopelagicales bacterium]
MPDWLRLSVGTLTALPVPAPRAVTRRTAGAAMLSAPLVGVALGVVAAVVLWSVRTLAGPAAEVVGTPGAAPAVALTDLLAAALALGAVAWATRGLHLDGLADTADGLASGRRGEQALAVMRRSDIGPAGVATLVLVLLAQVAALAVAAADHHGTTAAVVAVAAGRLGLAWACRRGVPAARPDGLGAGVAGTVPVAAAAAATALLAAVAFAVASLDDDASTRLLVLAPLAVLAGSVAAVLLVRRTRRRLGGISGDVLGAVVETATLAALLVLACA